MAKRNLFLHIGPHVPGVESPHDALRTSPAIAAARLRVPDVGARDLDLAAIDILRSHRSAGLRRKEVEGRWAEVCRRAVRARSDVVVSQPALAGGSDEQLALALDGFAGMRLHVVLTPARATDLPLSRVGTWATAVAAKGRLHVLPVAAGTHPEAFAEDLARLALHATEAERLLVRRRGPRERLERVLVRA